MNPHQESKQVLQVASPQNEVASGSLCDEVKRMSGISTWEGDLVPWS